MHRPPRRDSFCIDATVRSERATPPPRQHVAVLYHAHAIDSPAQKCPVGKAINGQVMYEHPVQLTTVLP